MAKTSKPAPYVAAREEYTVGEAVVIQGPAEEPPYSLVFEDDGETAYLYCLDLARKDKEGPIVDALHIYNVAQVAERGGPCKLEMIWSGDHRAAALFLNRRPQAVVDFGARRACCRTGFPPPREGWTAHTHDWDEGMLQRLGL